MKKPLNSFLLPIEASTVKFLKIAFVIFWAASCYMCSKKPDSRLDDSRVLLQVGANKLTLGDLEKQTQNIIFDDANKEFDSKVTYVDQAMDRFLLLEGAADAGLTAELDSAVIRRTLLRQFNYEKINKNIDVSDADIRRFFDRYGGEIQAGHLLVNEKRLADSLYKALNDGADFETLVRQFSTDEATTDVGGSLGYFQYGRFSEEFQEAAFALKIGEISRPILTRFGWDIIKLYDRKNNTQEELEKNKSKYRNLARKHQERAAQNRFKEMMKKKYHFEMIWPTIDLMAKKADSLKSLAVRPGNPLSAAYLDASLFSEAEKDASVVKYDGGGMKMGEFLGYLITFPPEAAPELKEHPIIEDFIVEILLPNLMEKEAYAEGFDKAPQFLSELAYIKDGLLAQKMRDFIYSSVGEVTYNDIAGYYNEHLEEFNFPDAIRASAIAVKTKKEAEDLLTRIKNGASFPQMAKKYSVDKMTGAIGGDLNTFSVKMYTPIYQAAEGLKIGDLGGPVEYAGNWWIFKLTDRMAKRPQPIELVASSLKSKILNERRKKAYDDFITEMKEKTQPKIDLELLKSNLRMGKYHEAGEPKG